MLILCVLAFFYGSLADSVTALHSHKINNLDFGAIADRTSRSLVMAFWNWGPSYFNTDNHGNTGFQYWPQAHGLDVVVDAYSRTKGEWFLDRINDWYTGVKQKNGNTWRNDYYDDMEWNCLAALRAYDATGDNKFRDVATELWGYIKQGWNDNNGGGIQWVASNKNGKNACSNGPAAIIAARMYRHFGADADRDWAVRIYEWERNTLYDASNGEVQDNINNGEITRWHFTYNQGTFLGAAVELWEIFGERKYLDDAVKAADYTLTNLVNTADNLLKDEGTGDGGLFKAPFVRYFTNLIKTTGLDSRVHQRYVDFLTHNAETLWERGTNSETELDYFGPYWGTRPGTQVGLTENISGCTLMEAMTRI